MPNARTVCVVDDDEGVRELLRSLLDSCGWTVRTFANGKDFVAAVKPSWSRCCALVDVMMPGLDGIGVLEEMAARQIYLPVIIITGHGEVSLAVKAMKGGAVDFIEKPIRDEDILEAVRRAFEIEEQAEKREAAAREAQGLIARLSPRQREVFDQVVLGRLNKVIGHELGISPRTVEVHRAQIMEKMQASSLPDLVRMALAAGVLSD